MTATASHINPRTGIPPAPRSPQFISQPSQVRMTVPASRLEPIEAPAPPDLPVFEVNVLSDAPPPSEAKPTEVKPTDAKPVEVHPATPEAPAAPVRKAHLWTPALDPLCEAPHAI